MLPRQNVCLPGLGGHLTTRKAEGLRQARTESPVCPPISVSYWAIRKRIDAREICRRTRTMLDLMPRRHQIMTTLGGGLNCPTLRSIP